MADPSTLSRPNVAHCSVTPTPDGALVVCQLTLGDGSVTRMTLTREAASTLAKTISHYAEDNALTVVTGDGRTLSLPMSQPPSVIGFLTLEVSSHCNLKCAGCARTVQLAQDNWQNSHMSIDLFRRIVDNLPQVGLVTLHGIGEPTLNPDLPEMVSYAHQSGKFGRIRTCTNGITRDAAYIRDLKARGLDALAVSVDSLDPAIAEKCRSGTKVEKLRRNLGDYAQVGLPMYISTVVSRHNAEDIPNLLTDLNGLGSFVVRLQPLWDYGNPDGCLTPAEEAALRETYAKPRPDFSNLTLEVSLSHHHASVCIDPWTSPSINVDGFFEPCCERRDPDDFGRLNLGEMTYVDAWRSATFQTILKRYATTAPSFCDGCPKNLRPVG